MNYTHVNSVDIFRFKYNQNIEYRFNTIINLFRDRSNDSLDLGRIGLSVYNKTMLLTIEKIFPSVVKYMPVCPYNHSLDNRTMLCVPCAPYQYATSFNAPACRPCPYPQDKKSLAALLELVYCNQEFLFDPEIYSYQTNRTVLSFQKISTSSTVPSIIDQPLNTTQNTTNETNTQDSLPIPSQNSSSTENDSSVVPSSQDNTTTQQPLVNSSFLA